MTRAGSRKLLLAIALCLLAARASATDFTAGNISGTVTWNGSAVTGPDDGSIYVDIPATAGAYVDSTGSYSFVGVAPGSYTLDVYDNGCSQASDLIGSSSSVAVTAGVTTTANVDITATAGKVTGLITVNGAPVSGPSISSPSLCGGNWRTNSDGTFEHFAPPGTYTASVSAGGGTIGQFTFTIVAGQTVNVGTQNFEVGSVAGSVTWNGAAVNGPDDSSIYVDIPSVASSYVDSTGAYTFSAIAPGNYTLGVYANGCTDSGQLGSASLVVPGGVTTNGDVDITATAGKVTGIITVNGVPVSGPSISSPSLCGGNWRTNSDGTFEHFAPPGTYIADVSAGGGTIGQFTFTVVAGQTVNVGTQDFEVGSVAGSVIWNGAAVNGPDDSSIYVDISSVADSYVDSNGAYTLSAIDPGSYTLDVYANGCTDSGMLGSLSLEVPAGVTTDGDVDITATAGKVTGIITVNGVPVNGPGISSPSLCGGNWRTNSDGTFEHFAPPGTYTADVSASGGPLGSFTFTITAGQTTSLDLGTTPVGSNIVVDAAGGLSTLSGIEVTYTTVTAAGTTTIEGSASGPAAPAGFVVIGPRYYAVSTTATYSGPVQVCIHYDSSKLVGASSSLELVDAANGFANLTSSLDTTNDIICGQTNAVSTFALMQPVTPIVTPSSVSVPPRGTQQFNASSGSGSGYTWSVTGSGSISTSGLYTAGISAGSAVVTLTDSAGGTAVAAVTVTAGVSVAPSPASLAPRAHQQFTASGGNGSYSWTAVAGTVSASGLYSAPAAGPSGDSVTATDSLGNSGSASITFTAPLALDRTGATLAPLGTQQFNASGGSGAGLTWTATAGNVSSTGLYTAPPTGPGSAIVTVTDSLGNTASAAITITANLALDHTAISLPPFATHQFVATGGSGTGYVWTLGEGAQGTLSASGLYTAGGVGGLGDSVTVTDSAGDTATAQVSITAGVSITPSTLTLVPHGTAQLAASGGTGTGYLWSASAGTITASGFYTAPGAGTPSATVTVKDSLGSTATASLSFTVGVVLDRAAVTLSPLGTHQFSATGGSGTGYAWSLQAPANGTLSASGLYTAGPLGNLRDTVTATDSLGNTASAVVTLTAATAVAPVSLTLAPRGTNQFVVTGGTGGGYVWSASAGTVTSSGLYTAPSAPPETSTVTVQDAFGNAAVATITFSAGLSLSPATVALSPLAAQQFTAAGGSNAGFTWSLESGANGTISASGLYRAGAAGSESDTVTVTDSFGNSASAQVAIGAGVSLDASAVSVAPHATHQFVASGGAGTSYLFSLQQPANGTIDADGLYTAGGWPDTQDVVTATDTLGDSASATVTITAGASITPALASVPPRGTAQLTAAGGSGEFTFTLEAPARGSISADGLYKAAATPGVSDTALATDSLGNSATAAIQVTAGVSISPENASVGPSGTRQFTAIGGSGSGYLWSLAAGGTGSISASGLYTAAGSAGTDTVTATDPLGNSASVALTITSAVAITPGTATIAPRASLQLSASGGSGTGYFWSLASGATGTITSLGVYTAGPAAGVTDTVQVTDSLGSAAVAQVTTSGALAITPASASVAPRGTQAFSASGGSGTGYVWTTGGGAVGNIDQTGLYTAGIAPGSDTVTVTDSLGNSATAAVTITAALAITPQTASVVALGTQQFTASGGAGGYTWTIHGTGTVSAAGLYTAGPTAGATDLVTVTDSTDSMATATVTVTPAPVTSGGCATTSGSAAPQLLGFGLALAGLALRKRRARGTVRG